MRPPGAVDQHQGSPRAAGVGVSDADAVHREVFQLLLRGADCRNFRGDHPFETDVALPPASSDNVLATSVALPIYPRRSRARPQKTTSGGKDLRDPSLSGRAAQGELLAAAARGQVSTVKRLIRGAAFWAECRGPKWPDLQWSGCSRDALWRRVSAGKSSRRSSVGREVAGGRSAYLGL